MKKLISLVIPAFFLITIQSARAQQFTIVKKGVPKSRIIIPERAAVPEIQAAKVLQDYIERMSGAVISIETDHGPQQEGEILIRNVNRPEGKEVPKEKLGKDGLFIKNNGKNLVIAGGTGKGILYAVYTFLEKYMG